MGAKLQVCVTFACVFPFHILFSSDATSAASSFKKRAMKDLLLRLVMQNRLRAVVRLLCCLGKACMERERD